MSKKFCEIKPVECNCNGQCPHWNTKVKQEETQQSDNKKKSKKK